MPADRCSNGEWSPKPDFRSHVHSEPIVDERVFRIYNEQDVANGLAETDPSIEAYKWLVPDDQLAELALESARQIIKNRRTLLLERQFEMAKAARDARLLDNHPKHPEKRFAVTAGFAQNLETGETIAISHEIEVSRAVG
jgi:hypothetical protein